DDFMFKALKARAPENEVVDVKRDLCRWTETLFRERQSPFDHGFDPSRRHPVVYHLHGHAEVPDSIVVSEDDYIDFTVNISSEITVSKHGKGGKARLPLAIRSALRNNTLLFVGYHVADQNLRIILRLVCQTLGMAEQRLNVAIQLPDSEIADLSMLSEVQQYLERRYRWSLRLQVYWGDAREFASELRKQINKRRRPAESHAA